MSAMNHGATWSRRRVRRVLVGKQDALRVNHLIHGRATGQIQRVRVDPLAARIRI